ncbi:MAG: DNA methyltransferase [Pseudomonadota bacterium]
MNAVEIEQAITELADQPFDPEEFPYAFLECFDNSPARAKKLRKGSTNKSDIGGVLQVNNIHITIADQGSVSEALAALRESPATQNKRHRVKFILATDGQTLEAEDLNSGETVVCAYEEFPDKFGFFLPLAGITTVKQIRENTFDVRATSRLNKLYVTLLQENPDWGTEERRHDMNHFMARLIFCFFAEDTDIFSEDALFTATVAQMSARDSSNTHEVISEIFRAMDVKPEDRPSADLPRWAEKFPHVNGELFSGSTDVPTFSRIAQKYLLHIGNLDWKQINPDIFGSMIQAVADEEERSALGMHYTSVPNILKVLNPLFLDDLREKLHEAGENPRKLLNLRKRMSNVRVFDPACGSGNFLVIAYKQMREIEAQINERRSESGRKSDIPLTNFRGIELRDFSAEIARLALIIAEYQADVVHIGQKEARQAFLPLNAQNWITCGNALRLDWIKICPPTGTGVRVQSDDLFGTLLEQAEIDFENEGGETYLCGNPPYRGSSWQTPAQKSDLKAVSDGKIRSWKCLDYVAGWFIKAIEFQDEVESTFSFVATKSINEGEQVPVLWKYIFSKGYDIEFAHLPFNWANLASKKAGVTVVIIGIGRPRGKKRIFDETGVREVGEIGPYLAPGSKVIVTKATQPLFGQSKMLRGNMPTDGGNFVLSRTEAQELARYDRPAAQFVRPFLGASEITKGSQRYCLWIEDNKIEIALGIPFLADRIEKVRQNRLASTAPTTRTTKVPPHRFMQVEGVAESHSIAVPAITTINRDYLPATILSGDVILSNKCYALYDAPLWNFSLASSTLHRVWIATICARMRNDFSYSNTLGWNTFPIEKLTAKNCADLTTCAEKILLARENHFPATIADLYDPVKMPDELRAAHDHNDEVLERIYIGRRFKNDTERLEKLFDMYTKMTTKVSADA